MSLREIARYNDVVEADLAAAFLESHGISVSVTERFHTTVNPLMQQALGIRLLGAASNRTEARLLLARAQAGEFASDDGDDVIESPVARTYAVGAMLAILVASGATFWGTSRPRRFRTVHMIGLVLIAAVFLLSIVASIWSYIELKKFYAEFLTANS